ncbi:PREDICTED: putative RING-H2 finger protein ATL19 [Tarenaya hassleriana]|uniref:putative RING-H2 finger protein ATL19 n=1 Tax=Tarenaya hassleriana TaxID=28532 RepID=UPI00053C1563|nr:PREDICTED: putative RING-H2 finger protein ATL19 [Tarenaya hassleriana]
MNSQDTYYDCLITSSALPPWLPLRNDVFIVFHFETREFIQDPSGVRTLIWYRKYPPTVPIVLDLRSPAPRHILQLLRPRIHDPFLCQQLATDIADSANRMGFGRQGITMVVNVKLINDTIFLVSGSSPSRGASEALLQRLVEEQSFDSAEKLENSSNMESEACAICLENLLGSEGALVQMPSCPHFFHRECLVEWLKRTNSCPLCRSVPYEYDESQ